jgi:hypothetical protein
MDRSRDEGFATDRQPPPQDSAPADQKKTQAPHRPDDREEMSWRGAGVVDEHHTD